MRDALIAKTLIEHVNPLQAAHHAALEVEFAGDRQRQVAIERVVVSHEWPRIGAARERLQDGRFDFDEPVLVHPLAQRRDRARAGDEQLARGLVRDQIQLAVAVAGLQILEAVVLGRRRAQRLGQQRALVHRQRELPVVGHIDGPIDAHQVAHIELEHPPKELLAGALQPCHHLDPSACVADIHEHRLAVSAMSHHPSGDPVAPARVLAGLQRGGIVCGVHRRDHRAIGEVVRIGVLAAAARTFDLRAALAHHERFAVRGRCRGRARKRHGSLGSLAVDALGTHAPDHMQAEGAKSNSRRH